MPSVLFHAGLSGGQSILSGYMGGSGSIYMPQTGVQVVASPSLSGTLYFGLSGGLAAPGAAASPMDGVPIQAGGTYFFPRGAFRQASGVPPQIFVVGDAACSGQKIYYEVY